MMPDLPDGDGTGEFAVGFGDSDSPVGPLFSNADPTPSVQLAKDSIAAVHSATRAMLDYCVEHCRIPGAECRDCLTGRIDNYIGQVGGTVAKLTEAVNSRLEGAIQESLTQVLNAVAEFPPAGDTTTAGDLGVAPIGHSTFTGSPLGGLPGQGGSIPLGPLGGGPAHTITVGFPTGGGGSIPLGPTGGGGSTITHSGGDDTTPTTSTVTTTPPSCLATINPPDQCTVAQCQASCAAAGGTWAVDELTGEFVCHGTNGLTSKCYANGGYVCLDNVWECANFVEINYGAGWRLRYDDPADPNTAYAFNEIQNLRIDCRGQCKSLAPKRGPCPRPKSCPGDAYLIWRDDGHAIYVDPRGTTYGEMCDISDCPIPPVTSTGFVNTWNGTVWVEWPDKICGWLTVTGFVQCPPVSDATVPLTMETVDEWIDQQDDPDDWDLVWNDDEGVYMVYQISTDTYLMIDGEMPAPLPPPVDEPKDFGGVVDFALTLPSASQLFAGRK